MSKTNTASKNDEQTPLFLKAANKTDLLSKIASYKEKLKEDKPIVHKKARSNPVKKVISIVSKDDTTLKHLSNDTLENVQATKYDESVLYNMLQTNTNSASHTLTEYSLLQKAFDYFNKSLFNDSLPHVMLTYRAKPNMRGYYSHERFIHRSDDTLFIGEIALNPETHNERDDKAILSTLVHEMVHLWQYCYGDPSSKAHHNKQWGDKMKEIGLTRS